MLPLVTQIRFVVWLLLGLAIYFGYGYNHSIISQARRGQLGAAPVPALLHRLNKLLRKAIWLIINPLSNPIPIQKKAVTL